MAEDPQKESVSMVSQVTPAREKVWISAARQLTMIALAVTAGWYAALYYSRPQIDVTPAPPATIERDAAFDTVERVAEPAAIAFKPVEFAAVSDPLETLNYTLEGRVDGVGESLGSQAPIGLDLNFGLSLDTLGVDSKGNKKLRMTFDEVSMIGDYMGSPVDLSRTGSSTHLQMNEREVIDTLNGDSVQGIPQLEFFGESVEMIVSPSGQVLDVKGPKGFDQIIDPVSLLSPVTFPEGELEVNQEWISEFKLPVPGLAAPANASARNTFLGYEDVNGYRCGVIRQEMLSLQNDGRMFSPSSALGPEMAFTMPEFEVRGTNYIYFDANDGKLVRTEFDMEFQLQLGEEFKALTDVLNQYSELLDEIEGKPRRSRDEYESEIPLLDMGVKIDATLNLNE